MVEGTKRALLRPAAQLEAALRRARAIGAPVIVSTTEAVDAPADPAAIVVASRRAGEPWFCIAGIWRTDRDVGEAFTMLTLPPGPDIAPYHDRQIAILDRADWAAWLDASVSARTILKPLPVGSLAVEQVG